MKTLFITIGCIFLLGMNGYATKCTCKANGEWDKPSTWSCGREPQGGDTIIIPLANTVTVTAKDIITGAFTTIMVYGKLEFEMGRKMELPNCSNVILAPGGILSVGGGGGVNQKITIGSRVVWSAGCGCGSCQDDCGSLIVGPKSYQNCVLPLNVSYFHADKQNNDIEFKWATENDDYSSYNLDVSEDGKKWNNITSMTGGQHYYYTRTVCSRTGYYRLGGLKPEAVTNYIKPVYVSCEGKEYTINLDSKTLTAKNAESIEILDLNGKTLIESTQKEISLLGLKEGVYILILQTPDKLFKNKIRLL